MFRVIITDSDESYRHSIWMILRDRYHVSVVAGELDAILAMESGPVDLLIYGAPGIGEGMIQFLRRVREARRGIPILLLPEVIRYRQVDEEVISFVTDVLQKPFTPFQLIKTVNEVLGKSRDKDKVSRGRGAGEVERIYQRLIESRRFSEKTRADAIRCSGHNAPVLLEGEMGTGKMLLARAIHHLGGKKGPFIRVDCRNASADAIAKAQDEGQEDGTLYFEVVEAMSEGLQKALIESLSEGMVKGGKGGATPLTLRILSATPIDLGERMIQGDFDEVLYQALRAVHVRLEPLRGRAAEMHEIVKEMVRDLSARHGLEEKPFQSDVIRTLVQYYWPGNITELQAVVTRALANSTGPAVLSGDIEFGFSVAAPAAEPRPPMTGNGLPRHGGVGSGRTHYPVPPQPTPLPVALPSDPGPSGSPGAAPVNGPSPIPQPGEPPIQVESLLVDIASNVKNPLVSLKTFVQLLDEKFDDPEFRGSFYKTVSSDLDRIDGLMDRLLHYVNSLDESTAVEEAGLAIEGLVKEYRERNDGGREIMLELAKNLNGARLEGAGLRFVVSGVLEEAMESAPERSTIHLSVSRRDLAGVDWIFVQSSFTVSSEKAIHGKVVEGLELRLASWLAQRLGGNVEITPTRGQVASVTIRWPIRD